MSQPSWCTLQHVAHKGPTYPSLHRLDAEPLPPTQPRSIPQHYHLVERQKQGIKFNFSSYGAIYVLDPFYLLSVILSGLVLLKFANTATNFYSLLGKRLVVAAAEGPRRCCEYSCKRYKATRAPGLAWQ